MLPDWRGGGRQQTGAGKQFPHLLHPHRKNILPRINQQNKVVAFCQFVSQQTVNFPAQTPATVSLYRIPELAGKRKSNTIALKTILKHQKLRAGAGNAPATGKNFPYFVPSL
jgi:hypothetical protein